MSGEPTFRKASDTRPEPETPKASLASLRAITGRLAAPRPGPYIGPVPNLPLTKDQASQLLTASGFPRSLEKFRNIFIEKFVTRSANLPQNERRSFEILLERAKHPCSKETLISTDPSRLGAYAVLEQTIKDVGDDPDFNLEEAVKGKALGVAAQIVDGFDVFSQGHFVFDKDGQVIDVVDREKSRYPKFCLPYLTSSGLKRAQASQFTQFLKETSDPYKGSQQGVGRTRKHKKKARKTLRRRKVRGNVH